MKVIDLLPEHEPLYFVCLEDWSDEMKEAGTHKKTWYEAYKTRGLRVKLSVDNNGVVGGMIQYLPVELSPAQGTDMNFVHCIWVHGHKKGRGDFRKQGMGKALIEAAENDTKAQGKNALVVWGISMPFFMKASWFKKRGYHVADKQGIRVLLWKPFKKGILPPEWVKPKKSPKKIPGQVTVSAFIHGCCPAQNIVFERAKRACAELGDGAVFQPYHTQNETVFNEWGIHDGLYIDDKQVRTGPPPSYKKIRSKINSARHGRNKKGGY